MPNSSSNNLNSAQTRCYGIRRVNPFLGVLQIIKTDAGRAITANGVVWDIELLTYSPGGWGSLDKMDKQLAYYRYGLWSQDDGLVSRPLASQIDDELLKQQCHDLIEVVRDNRDKLPFQLIDSRELWLFDSDNQVPIALLASSVPDSKIRPPQPRYWSSALGKNGVSSQYRFPGADDLEMIVKQRAGFNINRHWISRQQDGSGVIESSQTLLSIDMFPPFLITEQWQDAKHAELVNGYLEWIAPTLLTLQHLTRTERLRMEKCLNIQARSIEHHWHLYPEVIEAEFLTVARVKGRMQNLQKEENIDYEKYSSKS